MFVRHILSDTYLNRITPSVLRAVFIGVLQYTNIILKSPYNTENSNEQTKKFKVTNTHMATPYFVCVQSKNIKYIL